MLALPTWVLNVLIDMGLPIADFRGSKDDIEAAYNCLIDDDEFREISVCIARDLERNYIVIKDYSDESLLLRPQEVPKFIASADQMAVFMRLTPEGGRVWETQYDAVWSKYVRWATTPRETSSSLRIEALERETVESLVPTLPLVDFLLKDVGTIELLEPWEVMYWKQLPRGYGVTLEVISQEPDESVPWFPPWLEESFKWHRGL